MDVLAANRIRSIGSVSQRLDDPVNFFLAEYVSCVVIHSICYCALVGDNTDRVLIDSGRAL